MPQVSQQDTVPYTCAQMYDLVNQIDRYPSFIPWCTETQIMYQDDQVMVAALTFNFQGITQSFTTKNTLTAPHQIVIELVQGPFKDLAGTWHFSPVEHEGAYHCLITLDMDYTFSNSLVALVFEPAFVKLSDLLIQSFKEEAARVYV